ncbi:MAG: HvfC family RiPP maturation protein [Pseudomonadales bacterium]
MPDSAGSNLPDFRSVQLDFAAHIRNPDLHPRPADVSERRMQIYLDLFYNNIESFLAGAFPVAKRVLGSTLWHELARRFVHEHPSDSPYFLDISQEFLTFLDQAKPRQAPEFMLELCHYEWVELAAKVDERELPDAGFDPAGDLMQANIVVNPVLWLLSYRYPVHRIREEFQPQQAPAEPSLLAVYRSAEDQVRFLELSAVNYRLLSLLIAASDAAQPMTGTQALIELRAQMAAGSTATDGLPPSPEVAVGERRFMSFGQASLDELRDLGILLGSYS